MLPRQPDQSQHDEMSSQLASCAVSPFVTRLLMMTTRPGLENYAPWAVDSAAPCTVSYLGRKKIRMISVTTQFPRS
jgi:hypothetical protein